MESYAPFLARLVALLVGLAAGKALGPVQAPGGPLDRPGRRARRVPQYISG